MIGLLRGRRGRRAPGLGAASAKPASIWELPGEPAVYARCSDPASGGRVVVVGSADGLDRRVEQLLVNDSALPGGTGARSFHAEYARELRWWQHGGFADARVLRAAELIACALLDPLLRSRPPVDARVAELAENPDFRARMTCLFGGKPTGTVPLPNPESRRGQLRDVETKVGNPEKLPQQESHSRRDEAR